MDAIAYPSGIVHLAAWQGGTWLGLDDAALLIACAEAELVLVAFDRATLPWHAGQLLRAGDDHSGEVLFRRNLRSTDYGSQARLLTGFWTSGSALPPPLLILFGEREGHSELNQSNFSAVATRVAMSQHDLRPDERVTR